MNLHRQIIVTTSGSLSSKDPLICFCPTKQFCIKIYSILVIMVLFSYRQNQSVRLRPDRPPQSCHLLDKTAQIGTSRLCRKSGKFLRKKTLLSSSVRLSPIHWRTARRSDEVMYPVHCLSKTYNNILRKCEQYHGQSLLLHDNYGKPGGREAELTRKASRSSFSSSSGFDASRAPMLDIMSTNSSKENIPSPKSRLLV